MWVVGFLVFGLVLAIGAMLVIREAGRIARRPPAAIFDPDDAYEWVVAHLPDEVAATLTPDDVRRILGFQLEFIGQTGTTTNGNGSSFLPGVVGGTEQVDYILERAVATGEAYLPEQIAPVVMNQLSYLRAIGAIGPPADDIENGPPAP